jgi:hypothetical protein
MPAARWYVQHILYEIILYEKFERWKCCVSPAPSALRLLLNRAPDNRLAQLGRGLASAWERSGDSDGMGSAQLIYTPLLTVWPNRDGL